MYINPFSIGLIKNDVKEIFFFNWTQTREEEIWNLMWRNFLISFFIKHKKKDLNEGKYIIIIIDEEWWIDENK